MKIVGSLEVMCIMMMMSSEVIYIILLPFALTCCQNTKGKEGKNGEMESKNKTRVYIIRFQKYIDWNIN